MKFNSVNSTVVVALVLLAGPGIQASQAADASASANKLVIHADRGKETINRNIYGHFSEHLGRCIYEGYWVEPNGKIKNVRGIRQDVVDALKKTRIPVLRWPGGCFADEYHWKDGIGKPSQRPTMVNTHWGGVTENNHFGTHEFLDLCGQLQCEPYICGNVGSGTVQELAQWVEYVTFDGVSPMANLRRANGRKDPWPVKFWGVGNENWGCGGNMTPEFYADQYKRYATYVRNFGSNQVFKIACGPSGANTNWTDVLMREAGKRMNGLALHYYCRIGRREDSATVYSEEDWFLQMASALKMEDLVTQHSKIMDHYDPRKQVALIVDEWGTWHNVEPGTNPRFLYQQNTIRDALVAGLTLNIFNQHADRVKMANIAQTVNVLQAMVLTDKAKMLLTPTYHVFEMFAAHQDAKLLPTELQSASYEVGSGKVPAMNASASRDKQGKMHVSLCNLNPNASAEVACELRGAKAGKLSGRVLTAQEITAHNTFDKPENVKPSEFKAFRPTDTGFTVTLPPKSVVALEVN